jgi:hypothetical protein
MNSCSARKEVVWELLHRRTPEESWGFSKQRREGRMEMGNFE